METERAQGALSVATERTSNEAWRRLWAKRGTGSHADRWHSLIGHAIDVMMVALTLWEEVLPPQVRARMAGSLGVSSELTGRWISLWSGLHDIGKANPGFQARWDDGRRALKDAGLRFPQAAGGAQHGVVTAAVLPQLLERSGLPAPLALAIGSAVGGHHGVFPRADEWVDLGSRALGDEDWSQVRLRLYASLADLAVGTAASPSVALTSTDHSFYLLLAGLTCVADWIGSIEQHFTPAGDISDLTDYGAQARRQARTCLGELGWTRLPASDPLSFEATFGFRRNALQTAVMEVGELAREPGLIIVEAPMGGGKTEAAFQLADGWNSALDLAGAYVALPTEATSNQMFARFRRFLARRRPEDRVNLHLVHGHAPLSEAYKEVRISAQSEEGQAGVVAEEWFTPRKRALLAPFGVGTVDQILMAVLRVRHGFLRLFGLAQKTVIVDEVHAYDTYMSTILDRLLSWLSALGAPTILLSATLPHERRRQLIQAYGGAELAVPETPYPRITWVTGGRVGCRSFGTSPPRAIRVERAGTSPAAIAGRLADAVAAGGCAVWLCNTVGRAQQAYLALKQVAGALPVDLFHAQYVYGERERREARVVTAFGKDGPRPERAVLVATQVVEQSLDVDFDLMVTDPAPIDLILQRAGRLHRHPRSGRPAGMTPPRLWLVDPPEREGVPDFAEAAPVYEEYLLLRSWAAIGGRETLILPQDIDPLIQEVYGSSEPTGLSEAMRGRLESTGTRMRLEREREEREASSRMIRAPWYRDSILQAFDVDLDEEDPQVHVAFQALTRLGPPSVGLVCLHASPGGPTLGDDGWGPVDFRARPPLPLVERLLRHAVRISHRGLVPHLLSQDVPPGWRRCPFLRHHRLAVFERRSHLVGGWALLLDDELGLVIRREER